MTLPTQKSAEDSAREWLYSGGNGLEIDRGDEKALSVTFDGLVGFLVAYQASERTRQAELEKALREAVGAMRTAYDGKGCGCCGNHDIERESKRRVDAAITTAKAALE